MNSCSIHRVKTKLLLWLRTCSSKLSTRSEDIREDQGQGKHEIEGNRVDNRVEEDVGIIK